jgi:predicted phage terminase large subunit-like protein
VVVVHTRWHTDDLIGRLLRLDAHAGWEYLNIPAEAVDETDPLGREPGEFMVSAQGRSREQWELRKATAGPKAWQALYQGAPTTAQGDTFKRADWKRWRSLPESIGADGAHWLSGMDAIVSSWDLTFKGSATSDWCVGQVWAFRGAEAFLVHQVRARMAYPDQVAAVRAIAALYPQARPHLVEDKANGSAVLATLSTQVPGLVPVDPQRSKVVRANAVTPFVHAGNVWLPADDVRPWAAELVEEAAGFPLTAHDDQVDAMSQALSWRYLSGQYRAPDPNAVVFPDIG